MSLTTAGVTFVLCFTRYCLPGTSGSSVIHTTIASKLRSTRGRLCGCTSTSPRLTSISSASVTVIACGGNASSRSPSCVTMRFTVLVLPEGRATTGSPGRMMPEASVPQNPRKSRFGRLTYCTGNRMSIMLRSEAMWMFSSRYISVPPSYHGMFSLRCTTFSPVRALIGTKFRSRMSSFAANSL